MDFPIIQLLLFLGASLEGESNDTQLYLKIKKGDQKAFKTFFETHHEELFRFLTRKGVAKQAAEDLIQKAFIYIWENRSGIEEHKSLRAYLFRIAYTRMLNLFRDTEKFDQNKSIPDLQSVDSANQPDQDIHQRELNRTIEQAISSMPEKRQQVFRLCFIQEFTYKEAAEFMEVSAKTIENHMSLALKDLRKSLSEAAEEYL
ncbi:MAG: RNA polymerase sigma-70 factor [Balneola sp.]|jgi:RNA polymerase sigma-70 factor (ECF subfamily)|nr:RNA polymerase sigma-70 factor [Balneola sp.]MBE77636.1 RNA polymerase sigma-70 factor [Balneola sp.]HBX65750.1 RNA polymerase sigma-70 factor [Balneolaceae bacterium]|tara:strand:+ start:989 stop:1594 length:606 start_codon:yes stop_codon:yes gene_type:complete